MAVLATVAAGVYALVRQSSNGDGIVFILPTATPQPQLRVYLSGAVRNPGVYTVTDGDRLLEAIEAAGGATEDADLAAVNLAARMRDEDHCHVPALGEPASGSPCQVAGQSRKIDINSASLEELQSLPGIGESRAQAIIRHREDNGPLTSVDDLLEVRGIGSGILASIRDLVEVR